MKKILLSVILIAFCGFTEAQVYTATDSVDFAAWTMVDVDADGNDWEAREWAGSGTWYEPFGGAMNSYSYDNNTGPLTPDNLAIAPSQDLSGVSSAMLTWSSGTGETTASGWYEDHYSVYVVTDPTAIATAMPVFETTLLAGETVYNESVDITSIAAGQATVYVAFRHFNCTDEWTVTIDEVSIWDASSVVENTLEAKAYPNPANDVLNISTSGMVETVSVTTMEGQVVINETVNSLAFSLNTSDLAPGVYIYSLEEANGTITRNSVLKK